MALLKVPAWAWIALFILVVPLAILSMALGEPDPPNVQEPETPEAPPTAAEEQAQVKVELLSMR